MSLIKQNDLFYITIINIIIITIEREVVMEVIIFHTKKEIYKILILQHPLFD